MRCRKPSHPEQSTFLIALIGTGDLYQVMRESSGVIRDTYRGGDVIYIVQMPERDEAIWTDIRAVGIRFYDRVWGRRIGSTSAGGNA